MTAQSLPQTAPEPLFRFRHLLGIEGLQRPDIERLLDQSDVYVDANRQGDKKHSNLRGRTLINLFFENSTRTRTSFELAGKRLGGDQPPLAVEHLQRVLQVGFDHFANDEADRNWRDGEPEAAHEIADDTEDENDPDVLHGLIERVGANYRQSKNDRPKKRRRYQRPEAHASPEWWKSLLRPFRAG